MYLKYFLTAIISIGLVMSPLYVHSGNNNAKTLPYGLQKKVEKGQSLPPGWEKKLKVGYHLERDIYRQGAIVVPLDSRGLLTIRLEGKLVRLVGATREIVEILN